MFSLEYAKLCCVFAVHNSYNNHGNDDIDKYALSQCAICVKRMKKKKALQPPLCVCVCVSDIYLGIVMHPVDVNQFAS